MADQKKQIEKQIGEDYKEIGRLLSENIGQGIAESSDTAKAAMDQLHKELLASYETYAKEKALLEQEIEATEEAKQRRDYYNRLSKAKTATQIQNVQNSELLRLQKKADDAYIDELEQHLSSVEALMEAQKKIIVSEFDEIAQRATKSISELEKAREKMAEKMSAYADLFEEHKHIFLNSGPGGTPEIFKETILDLSEEREQLEKYAQLLAKIQEKAEIPKELFRAIRELSIEEAIKYQEALLDLDQGKLSAYLKDWEAIQKLSAQTAQESYAEDIKWVLNDIEAELATWYGTIPEGFFQEGVLAADSFGKGFVSKLSSLQNTVQEAVQTVLSNETLKAQNLNSQSSGMQVRNERNVINYIINSAKETVSQQLRSVRSYAEVEKLREG